MKESPGKLLSEKVSPGKQLPAQDLLAKLAETKLPLVPHLGTICDSLNERGIAIVRSDPGSGKSTLVPLALMDSLGSSKAARILMLEPRRAAALSIASRMADILGEEPGEHIGYSVRLRRKVSGQTRVEVLTEGLLVRRLQNDPDLTGVSTVIFDEFHERSVHTDLALALLLDLRRLGSPVRILIMSATMDAEKIAGFIGRFEVGGKVPVIDCPGRVFPVTLEYRPIPERASLGAETAACIRDVLTAETISVVNTKTVSMKNTNNASIDNIKTIKIDNTNNVNINDAKSDSTNTVPGAILAFLPGKREIGDAAAALSAAGLDRNFDILSLHGGLPLDRQRQVLGPVKSGDKRRIILSTNVAETGLTVPGVTLVVDAGYARIGRFHLPTGMNRLVLEPVSRQSADQRAGRAGRLMPGRCIRLWAENTWRPEETVPEILRIDLSGLVLECLLWGVSRPEELPWPDPPPAPAWDQALVLLQDLGAADQALKVTGRGGEMAKLGLEPRLGMLCIAGRDAGKPALGCAAAAILSERPPPDSFGDAEFAGRLKALRTNRNSPWARQVAESARDLLNRLGMGGLPFSWSMEDEADCGELLAAAFPDRLALRQETRKFRFVSGREALVQDAAAGAWANQEWLVAPEVDPGERTGYIRLAAPVSAETALRVLKNRIELEETIQWNGLVPRSVIQRMAGRIILSREQRPSSREAVIGDLPGLLEKQGMSLLPWDEGQGEGRRLLERIRFFMKRINTKFNNNAVDTIANNIVNGNTAKNENAYSIKKTVWDDEALIQEAGEWLGPFIWEGRESGKGAIIDGGGLVRALETRLGWELKRRLDAEVPDLFALPKGRKRPIDYSSGEPMLSLRLQDAFGIRGAPQILGLPVVFCLLSPAGRPIQTTRDLPGFWQGSYADVRKEMRGRYPKHNWPEPGALM
ncbi:ATP-dependent helicase HrpB [Treponema primitia ZAS-2]|uniref:ATP-dependent helicase HrpB n=1 Tax=Treponema primitia (strain ATCC BAA-887 / DSM 12427 / ZAS-2) TaxID=545694 RepID=F5YR94_TREPZ|nr:ATP-dependent helicase C-terminal domain-containing protein [Treponema primitia]AEF86379.1 ATP-dependent helicase HrpB [Treponema primitia ZAS-2]